MAKTQEETRGSAKINKHLNSRRDCRTYRNHPGFDDILKIKYGWGTGTADQLGYIQIVITPEMVGMKIAPIFSCEVKRPGEKLDKGAKDGPQRRWHDHINDFGGIAIVATSPQDAEDKLRAAVLERWNYVMPPYVVKEK